MDVALKIHCPAVWVRPAVGMRCQMPGGHRILVIAVNPPLICLSPSSVGRTLCFLVPALARFLVSQCVLIDFAADSSAHDAAKTQGRPMENAWWDSARPGVATAPIAK